MKNKITRALCALLCAAAALSLFSCSVRRVSEDESAALSPSGAGRESVTPKNVPVAATEPQSAELNAGAETDAVQTYALKTDVETDEWIEPEPIEIDGDKIELQYDHVTPAVNRAMITSTERGVLQPHGDFTGCAEALSDLEALLDGFDGEITLIAYAVDGSRSLCYNTDTVYQPQCTYKAAFIYSICQYMDAVDFDDSTVFTLLERNKMEGSGTVQEAPVGTEFSVHDLVTLCMSISDNAAFSLLHDHFGGELRNAYMGMIGANDLITSRLYGNNIRIGDFIILWNEIYNYFLADTYYSHLMKSACTGTIFAYAKPENGLAYSHKSGDGFDKLECHDVELVWDDVPYILAIYTRANSEGGSHPTIENAAKIVHERIY